MKALIIFLILILNCSTAQVADPSETNMSKAFDHPRTRIQNFALIEEFIANNRIPVMNDETVKIPPDRIIIKAGIVLGFQDVIRYSYKLDSKDGKIRSSLIVDDVFESYLTNPKSRPIYKSELKLAWNKFEEWNSKLEAFLKEKGTKETW